MTTSLSAVSDFDDEDYAELASWFQLSLPAGEAAAVAKIPIATACALYPDIAAFGPNGAVVRKLFEDLERQKERVFSVDYRTATALSKELQTFDGGSLYLEHYNVLGDFIDENLDNLTITFFPDDGPLGYLEDLVYEPLAVVSLAGLPDLPQEWKYDLERTRESVYPIFDLMLDLVGLNGVDYIPLSKRGQAE